MTLERDLMMLLMSLQLLYRCLQGFHQLVYVLFILQLIACYTHPLTWTLLPFQVQKLFITATRLIMMAAVVERMWYVNLWSYFYYGLTDNVGFFKLEENKVSGRFCSEMNKLISFYAESKQKAVWYLMKFGVLLGFTIQQLPGRLVIYPVLAWSRNSSLFRVQQWSFGFA